MDNTGCAQGIPSNPDIAGIGVRISIYLQVVLSFVPTILALFLRDGELCFEIERFQSLVASGIAMFGTVLALIVSALIQASTGQLTVYHALIVLNLSWLITFNTLLITFSVYSILPASRSKHTLELFVRKSIPIGALGLREGQSAPFYGVESLLWLSVIIEHFHVVHVASSLLLAPFGVWLFGWMSTFDKTSPDCTRQTIFSFFGISVIIEDVRTYCIVLYSFFGIPYFGAGLLNTALLGAILAILAILFLIAKVTVLLCSSLGFPLLCNGLSEQIWKAIDYERRVIYLLAVSTAFSSLTLMISTEETIGANSVQVGEDKWHLTYSSGVFCFRSYLIPKEEI